MICLYLYIFDNNIQTIQKHRQREIKKRWYYNMKKDVNIYYLYRSKYFTL